MRTSDNAIPIRLKSGANYQNGRLATLQAESDGYDQPIFLNGDGHVAEGTADLYPRIGRTMEWDIAAGHAVLLAAGGSVETLDGKPLGYGKPGLDNPHFVARGAR